MHLLLTDRLACPRCGPTFGLILLAEQLQDRRVIEGSLGCPNCRERYPVTQGFGDLRPPPRGPLDPVRAEATEVGPAGAEAGPSALALPIAAAVGAVEGPGQGQGHLLVFDDVGPIGRIGRIGRILPSLREVLPDGLELVVVGDAAAPGPLGRSDQPGISRLAVGPRLPFFDRTFRGVVVGGPDLALPRLREAARVLASGHRVVVLDPSDETQVLLGGVGLTRFVRAEGFVAAGR